MDEHLSELVEQLHIDFESNTNGDLEIQVNNRKFKVYRHILCLRSPVFAAMFQNDTKEKQTNTIKIDQFEPEMMKKFLLYLYTATIENLDLIAMEMFKIADYYDVKLLRKTCVDHMKQNVTKDTVFDYYELAEKYLLENLKTKTHSFLIVHINESVVFSFYEFAKKHNLHDVEEEVFDFIMTNLTKISILPEWQKFDAEFRLKMFQEFFDQGPVIEVKEKKKFKVSAKLSTNMAGFISKCYAVKNMGQKYLDFRVSIVNQASDAEVFDPWTKDGFIGPGESADVIVYFKKPKFSILIRCDMSGKFSDDEYFSDDALVREIRIDPKKEYPLI